jgi:hypothetical protein
MTTGEKPLGQRKLRQSARAKLAQLAQHRAESGFNYDEDVRNALSSVIAASRKARPVTTEEFRGHLALEGVVIGNLATDPDSVKLWRPTGQIEGSPSISRRDGRIIDTEESEAVALHIASRGDTCCVSFQEATEADKIWEDGGVLITNPNSENNWPALVLPRRNVPIAWIGEALSRHFNTQVSPPELVA